MEVVLEHSRTFPPIVIMSQSGGKQISQGFRHTLSLDLGRLLFSQGLAIPLEPLLPWSHVLRTCLGLSFLRRQVKHSDWTTASQILIGKQITRDLIKLQVLINRWGRDLKVCISSRLRVTPHHCHMNTLWGARERELLKKLSALKLFPIQSDVQSLNNKCHKIIPKKLNMWSSQALDNRPPWPGLSMFYFNKAQRTPHVCTFLYSFSHEQLRWNY